VLGIIISQKIVNHIQHSYHIKTRITNKKLRARMLIDTHCHINMMIKSAFDVSLEPHTLPLAKIIVEEAHKEDVSVIINVGTRHVENQNCILLAQHNATVFATVGIHPNDSDTWAEDIRAIKKWVIEKEKNKIVGIGECGIDRHYPDYNMQRQRDCFKAQIEIALEHDLALVIHSRDAYDETLKIVEEYKDSLHRAVMHCFSYDQSFALTVIEWQFKLGIGGTVTYPKNDVLRAVVKNISLQDIVLETDAPFLPVQNMRGKKNHPLFIKQIAEYIAQLRQESYEHVAQTTTESAIKLFNLQHYYDYLNNFDQLRSKNM
jgi:TatD DNase family protein